MYHKSPRQSYKLFSAPRFIVTKLNLSFLELHMIYYLHIAYFRFSPLHCCGDQFIAVYLYRYITRCTYATRQAHTQIHDDTYIHTLPKCIYTYTMRYIDISQDTLLALNIINKTAMNMCVQPLYGCKTSFVINKNQRMSHKITACYKTLTNLFAV